MVVAQSAINASDRPITKVVTLLKEMKAQTEKEAADDLESYDKYNCWVVTQEKEKTEAIANGEAKIAELSAFLEESAAKQGQLKTEIEDLADDIAEDNEALETATATREKENKEFLETEADMKETLALLKESIDVLSKVQLAQTKKASGPSKASQEKAAQALLQVQNIVRRRYPKFQKVMQEDLFDMLGSLRGSAAKEPSFLSSQKRLLPWEKTEEQIGMEANPNDLKGAVQAKSYNSRSGRIFGILEEMAHEFGRDLAEAQKIDFHAEVAFQKLRAAKLAEIAAATEQKKAKEAALADSLYKSAKAQEEKEATETVLESDTKFLAEVRKLGKEATEEYEGRVKVRSEEIRALGETIKILTADEARDLFGKTIAFLQISSTEQSRVAAQDRASERAMRRLVDVAKRHKNWALASLAVRVRLDAFTKVKEAIDVMVADLRKQQSDEYDKWETCKQDIDVTEDNIKVGLNTKEDLDIKHTDLTNSINTLNADIESLKKETAEMEVALKQAGEERHNANGLFQTSVMDQRATINILNKAQYRLEQFYTKKTMTLAQTGVHPDTYNAPPPEKPKGYERQANSGGIMQMLQAIITDAEEAEIVLTKTEQKAQKDYAEYVSITTSSIEANRASVAEKTAQVAALSAELAETEEAQLANDAHLADLRELLAAHHANCDYILKYFDVRQKARLEEIDALLEAKAILSGANYGR